uniref:Uncharacterized protein n=1 Tax=Sanxia levi-like virus 1 TaxID=1923359 RepID=A0A1L3KIF0_9VIRU|nr:hypothetical protein [Sanxia levi-like virus 1]
MRTRNRTSIGTYRDPLSATVVTEQTRDLIIDDSSAFKKHSPCLHFKHKELASGIEPSGAFMSGISDSQVTLALLTSLDARLECLYAPQPKFIRNNQFDLLPFLADLDDTLSMFSLKFIKNFSYGSFTWGIVPFLNDVRALTDSYRDITLGFEYYVNSTLPVERIESKFQFYTPSILPDTTYLSGSCLGEARVVAAARASLDIAFNKINRMYFLLDELGANPDLAAVWDSLPLSFVVDYFVNIGEVLESFHPRGWMQYDWSAIGYHSCKGTFQHDVRNLSGNNSLLSTSGEFYIRSGLGPRTVMSRANSSSTKVEFKSPDLRQWFNVVYLFTFLGRIL